MPCDYSKYPLDWFTRIRPEILARAGNCCEECGLPNYAVIRGFDRKLIRRHRSHAAAAAWKSAHEEKLRQVGYAYGLRIIVLTIAHLDHELLHNDYSNLKALCQACHNQHDAPVRATRRAATLAASQDYLQPRLALFPLKRRDVMPSMRDHHAIAPLIDPAS